MPDEAVVGQDAAQVRCPGSQDAEQIECPRARTSWRRPQINHDGLTEGKSSSSASSTRRADASCWTDSR